VETRRVWKQVEIEAMNKTTGITHQQKTYESVYSIPFDAYGFPDRKIEDTFHLQGKRILNLGCGTASDIWHIASQNKAFGMDYAVSGLKAAGQHGVQGVVGDLNFQTILPFADKSFDIIICKDILEHILEPLAVLQEVRRLLKDDGYIILSVPNHFYLSLRIRFLLGKGLIWKAIGSDHTEEYDEWNYMHLRFFTFQGFKCFLKTANVVPEKWFWDFGGLAHYNDPDMYFEPQLRKKKLGIPLSRRGKLGLLILRPLWLGLNVVFPRPLRSWIVSLLPGLLSAGFYVRVRKA
jgi:2-polyprenyl-3-methyl-5-hydroxy-6-metoxy-1,4-benzoquinol methylase